jgi:hypothetical protein
MAFVTSRIVAAYTASVGGGTGGNGAGTGLTGVSGSAGTSVVVYT